MTQLLFTTLSIVAALYLGQILSVVLPTVSPLLDRKPFNCRPCTTFHLTWMLMAVVALIFSSVGLLLAGVVIAFIVFAVVRYIDNKKINK